MNALPLNAPASCCAATPHSPGLLEPPSADQTRRT